MKKTILSIIAFACAATTWAGDWTPSKYDANAPVGFATLGEGTTGSNDENPIIVEDEAAFKKAMKGTEKATIYLKGTITVNGQIGISGAENKTVYGLPGSMLENPNDDTPAEDTDEAKQAAIAKTGVLKLDNCKNIIMRNITFKSAGACDFNARDNMIIQASNHIWIDHCDFQDGVDGNFDIVHASDFISVTWCRFRYLKSPRAHGFGGSSDAHAFSNLIGNSDNRSTDEGFLHVTFANCWWDRGCVERMPRVRFGQVHLINCLYDSPEAKYGIGVGYKANVYVEKCAFFGVPKSKLLKNPWKNQASKEGFTDYNIILKDCFQADDVQSRSGQGIYFIPSDAYKYDSYSADRVKGVLCKKSNGAGATLQIAEPNL